MRIPIKYNIRSLLVRRTGSLMTAVGIGLTVAIVVVMLAMIRGLDLTFIETGDQLHLVVLRKGSPTETNSYFTRDLLERIRFLPGIVRSGEDPLAVGELTVVTNHNRKNGTESNIVVRGTSEMGFQLRPEIRIVEGSNFTGGLRQLIVSRSISNRFAGLSIGDAVEINNVDWTVVGLFESNGGAFDSEIWTGYNDVADVWQRPILSSALLRAESAEAAQSLAARISDDEQIQLDAVTTADYFASQTVSSVGLKVLATFIAIVLGIGSCFAIMNMMYGAVMARQQEVATLRALGFRRRSILGSFLLESALLSLAGGALGCLLGFLFNGYSAGTTNFVGFSEVVFNFRVTPGVVGVGLCFALFMGVVGGFLPARRAATVRLIDVLRQ